MSQHLVVITIAQSIQVSEVDKLKCNDPHAPFIYSTMSTSSLALF